MGLQTLYTTINTKLADQLRPIKLLVCDIDGVFSDGSIYLGNNGDELKAFNTRDGYGVKALLNNGIQVAVITGRRSRIVEERMESLGVEYVIQGEENKREALSFLMNAEGYHGRTIAVLGDDVPDTGMYDLVSVRIAVADAHPLVVHSANWVTTLAGGKGAVREVADTILQVQGKLKGIQASSI